jgi:predicted permease
LSGLPVPLQIGLLVLLFAVGFVARRAGALTPSHAGNMLRLVVTVGLPALFIADVSRIPLRADLVLLPVSAVLVMFAMLALTIWTGRRLRLPDEDQGALALCTMSMNNALLFPFVIAGWGSTGFAQLALFDFGHALMQGSVVYVVAATYGGHGAGALAVLRRVCSFPPLWALVIALAINVSGYALPAWITTSLGFVGRTILLLVVVALGVLFDAAMLRSRNVGIALGIRVVAGFAMGALAVWLFDLEGMTRAVVLLGSAAPIGFSAVVVASRESLNRDLAASAASVSVLLGLVYIPLGLWLLKP